jgi:hypothetical protein
VLTNSLEIGDTYIEARDLLEKTIDLLESARNVEILPNQVVENINFLYLMANFKLTILKYLRIPLLCGGWYSSKTE